MLSRAISDLPASEKLLNVGITNIYSLLMLNAFKVIRSKFQINQHFEESFNAALMLPFI